MIISILNSNFFLFYSNFTMYTYTVVVTVVGTVVLFGDL